ncbi:MAG: hypothetical protein ACYTGQ_16270, partial [Planctomycetota bacterium]
AILGNPLAQQFHPQIVRYPEDALAWVLIQQEAAQQGVYFSSAAARQLLVDVQGLGVDVNGLLRRTGMVPEQFAAVLQHVQMFLKLRDKVSGPGATSVPRLHHLAQDIGSRASIQLAVIDPRLVLEEGYEPSEGEIANQFETYRNDLAGAGEPFGFGYKLPDRVKLEYIGVPLERVAESIEVDDIKANRFYLDHPERYMPTPEAPDPAASDEEGEEPKPVVTGPKPYREVRDQVMQDVRDREAEDQQTKIVAWLRREMDRQIGAQGLELDDRGAPVFPEGYAAPSLEDLAKKAQAQFNLLPSVVKIDSRWMSLDDVRQMEGFGSASAQIAGRPVSVVDLIRSVQEFDAESSGPLASLNLRVHGMAPAVKDFTGDAYLFRLTAAQAEHVPAAVDEVRADVVVDLKALKAFSNLKNRTDILLGRLKEEGLGPVAESFKATAQPAGPFAKIDTTLTQYTGMLDLPWLPVVGQSEAVVDAVIARGRAIEEQGGIEEVDGEEKFVVVTDDMKLRVCLIELTDYQPVDKATFQAMTSQQLPMYLAMIAGQDQVVEGAEPPMSVEALIERLGYVSENPVEEEETDAAGDLEADASATSE